MVKKYTINCKLCGQIHYPSFGNQRIGVSGIVGPTEIVIRYKCPVTDKDGEVTYPFNQDTYKDIYARDIIGWKNE